MDTWIIFTISCILSVAFFAPRRLVEALGKSRVGHFFEAIFVHIRVGLERALRIQG